MIFIPWRAISWEIEHALQAAFVYGHLYQTRLQYSLTLDPGIELNNMIEATTYSKNNAVYLLGELLKFQNFFTEEALNLIKNLALKCQ